MERTAESARRLEDVVLEYLSGVDAGRPPDRSTLLATHPHLAADLAEFFDAQDAVSAAAAPLRAVAGTAAHGPVADPLVGRTLGGYEVVRVIARGPVGGVYEAVSRQPARRVALKLIRVGGATADEARRFRAEVETAAGLAHPNIVPVYDAGEADGSLYFSMKLCEGGSLADRPRRFVDDPRGAAGLVATVARAVHFAHQRGVLHRDLKPSNVLLAADDRPLVADFGLAKRLDADGDLTQTGVLIGTPSYMAPEQAAGRPAGVTMATDVYGLGAVLYALLTGRPPCRGETLLDTLRCVQSATPDPPRRLNPKVDRDLETVCLKCLEKDPAGRYPSAEDLAADLDRWAGGRPVEARPVGSARRAWRWARRNPLLGALGALAGLLAIGLGVAVGVGAVLVSRERAEVAAQRAEVGRREAVVRRHLYAADIRLAAVNWRRNRAGATTDLLARQIPGPGQEDLRGFEWHYLWGLAHADPPALRGHAGDVYSVSFDPVGRRAVTAGRDGTARLWDVAARRELARFVGHTGEVNVAVLSPDGRSLATAGDDGAVRLWDADPHGQAEVAAARLVLRAHDGEVSALAFAPDGRSLVSAGLDGRVRAWDPATGQEIWTRHDHTKAVQAVAFAADGRTVASGGEGGWAFVRDAATGEVRQRCEFRDAVHGLAFAPDGRTLAAATEVSVRTHPVGRPGAVTELVGPRLRCHSVAFSPDGTTLAAGTSDPAVWVWDAGATDPRAVYRAEPDRVWAVAFSPDGRTLAAADRTGTVRLLNPAVNPEADCADLPGPALGVTFSTDGAALAVVAFAGQSPVVRVLDGRTLHTRADLPVVPGPDIAAAVADRGDVAAVAVSGGPVTMWDVTAVQRLGTLADVPPDTGVKLALSADAGTVAVAWREDRLRLWDARTLRPRPAGLRFDGSWEPTALAFAPAGDLLAVGGSDRVVVWDVAAGSVRTEWRTGHWAGHLLWSPDGRTLAVTAADGTILTRDLSTGATTAREIGRTGTLSPNGRTAAAWVRDGAVELWHVPTGQELMSFPLPEAAGAAFSPDGRALAAVGRGPRGKPSVFVWRAAGP